MADPPPPRGCSGDGCNVDDIWPLHSVRYRGKTTKLCTSCILKSNQSAFCSSCFDLLHTDSSSSSSSPVTAVAVHCQKCPAAAHRACLETPDAPFICRSCASDDPRFSYFSPAVAPDGRRRLDAESARVLLAAARISSASMSRTAAIAWVEAERKVRDAAILKKRAQLALEQAIDLCKKKRDRDRQRESQQEARETKKSPKKRTDPNHQRKPPIIVQKSRDKDRWERFNNPCCKSLKDDSVAALLQPLKGREQAEEQIKGLPVSNGICVKPEKTEMLPSDVDTGLRASHPSQDEANIHGRSNDILAGRSNGKAIVAGLPTAAGLKS